MVVTSAIQLFVYRIGRGRFFALDSFYSHHTFFSSLLFCSLIENGNRCVFGEFMASFSFHRQDQKIWLLFLHWLTQGSRLLCHHPRCSRSRSRIDIRLEQSTLYLFVCTSLGMKIGWLVSFFFRSHSLSLSPPGVVVVCLSCCESECELRVFCVFFCSFRSEWSNHCHVNTKHCTQKQTQSTHPHTHTPPPPEIKQKRQVQKKQQKHIHTRRTNSSNSKIKIQTNVQYTCRESKHLWGGFVNERIVA